MVPVPLNFYFVSRSPGLVPVKSYLLVPGPGPELVPHISRRDRLDSGVSSILTVSQVAELRIDRRLVGMGCPGDPILSVREYRAHAVLV